MKIAQWYICSLAFANKSYYLSSLTLINVLVQIPLVKKPKCAVQPRLCHIQRRSGSFSKYPYSTSSNTFKYPRSFTGIRALDDYDLQPTAQRRYSNGGYTGKRGPFSFCKFQLLILSEYIFENIEYRAIHIFKNYNGNIQLRIGNKYISLCTS